MIDLKTYTKEEMDLLFTVVENAVEGDLLLSIDNIVKPGDFYLVGSAANGLLFTFNGLTWEKDGVKYDALLQPWIYKDNPIPTWRVVITRSLNGKYQGCSSGNTDMIKTTYRKYA